MLPRAKLDTTVPAIDAEIRAAALQVWEANQLTSATVVAVTAVLVRAERHAPPPTAWGLPRLARITGRIRSAQAAPPAGANLEAAVALRPADPTTRATLAGRAAALPAATSASLATGLGPSTVAFTRAARAGRATLGRDAHFVAGAGHPSARTPGALLETWDNASVIAADRAGCPATRVAVTDCREPVIPITRLLATFVHIEPSLEDVDELQDLLNPSRGNSGNEPIHEFLERFQAAISSHAGEPKGRADLAEVALGDGWPPSTILRNRVLELVDGPLAAQDGVRGEDLGIGKDLFDSLRRAIQELVGREEQAAVDQLVTRLVSKPVQATVGRLCVAPSGGRHRGRDRPQAAAAERGGQEATGQPPQRTAP